MYSMNQPVSVPPAPALRILAAAPHRLLFGIGATNVLLAMLWWALWLAARRWGPLELRDPAVPAGWMHAVIMQYQVLPSFMFGFLLTVFPRWMNLPPLTQRHYVPVGAGLLGGQVLTLAGLWGGIGLLEVGALFTFCGWSFGLSLLVRLLIRQQGCDWHALSCAFALGFGLLGFTLYGLFLWTFDVRAAFAAIKIGGAAMLLPIFFTVCHRMIPFFTNAVLPDYRMVRPMWALALAWPLLLVHVWLELRHGNAWLWIVDAPLALLFGGLLLTWWPRAANTPALLKVLFLGFAWLPLAFLLYTGQSAWFALTGEFLIGRGPAHALYIGCFGSLLVAMVTRVTQGHSGRPLVLGGVAAIAFGLVQVTAVVRVCAELLPDAPAWQAIAAACWVLAFLPWVVRSTWIYLTPRIDGRPG
jgi:uncharacterized protein involved in response to NO